jgi:hypothetical protein
VRQCSRGRDDGSEVDFTEQWRLRRCSIQISMNGWRSGGLRRTRGKGGVLGWPLSALEVEILRGKEEAAVELSMASMSKQGKRKREREPARACA